jgi:hypothetical protein
MSEIHEKRRPVLVFVIAIILLLALSYLPSDLKVLGYDIKPVDLLMDIKPDSLLDFSSIKQKTNIVLSKEILDSKIPVNPGINRSSIYSSVSLNLLSDFLKSLNKELEATTESFQNGPQIRDVPISGNVAQMSYFYSAVKISHSTKIRIAHYGDSGIEGDLITADIRRDLQKEFGGNGVGMLAITSQDIMFRSTTRQSFSDNWSTYNVVVGNPKHLPLGMNGFVSVPNGPAWVKYQTTSAYPDARTFSTVRIFYTNAKNSSIKYSFNDGAEQTAVLSPGNGVKELTLNGPDNSRSFKMSTSMANQAEFFGVSMEDGNGVYVDNYPWRGNSGISFRNLTDNTLKDFDRLCNYKLIILAFGGNVASPIAKNYNWYEDEMIKNINLMKSMFPQTSFLLLGAGDKSIKRGSKFVTDPGIPLLIKTQEQIAEKTGIAFWNTFEAMGGMNSMEQWVYANPPLALRDYTHVTAQGASKIGEMIADAILASYRKYR